MPATRLPRFQRSDEIATMRLTSRDREILHHVHRHRFLRSDHIASLLGGSRQQTLRRLRLLYHHGFLERPTCQIDYFYRYGSRPMVYGLSNKGAGLLKRESKLPFHRLQWPRKNGVERFFLEHALMISEFMVALELACRTRTDLRLLTSDEMNPPDSKAANANPFQWRINLGKGVQCGVVPDRVFGLEFPNGERTWFCLEADRGTMPVKRRRMDHSSFQRKLLAYAATWTKNIHRDCFGWQRFRVLTITTSASRVSSLVAQCRELESGQGLFLFTESVATRCQPDVLATKWLTSREGQHTRMI